MEMTITRNGVLTRCEDPGPTVTVPDGVREIGRRPFKGNPAEIVLPDADGADICENGTVRN